MKKCQDVSVYLIREEAVHAFLAFISTTTLTICAKSFVQTFWQKHTLLCQIKSIQKGSEDPRIETLCTFMTLCSK